MKDEVKRNTISEFVGLKSTIYSFVLVDGVPTLKNMKKQKVSKKMLLTA